jgi:hypothetical protein
MARTQQTLLVYNRFDILASVPVDEEPEESGIAEVTSSKQKIIINDEQQTKNPWEIPEYVEKPIPCSSVLTTEAKTTPPVRKIKKPFVDRTIREEQQEETPIPSTVEVQNQSTSISSYYPPQPYKFKPSLSSE